LVRRKGMVFNTRGRKRGEEESLGKAYSVDKIEREEEDGATSLEMKRKGREVRP